MNVCLCEGSCTVPELVKKTIVNLTQMFTVIVALTAVIQPSSEAQQITEVSELNI